MSLASSNHVTCHRLHSKTTLNCNLVIPQWQPKTPPAWLSGLMDRIGSPKYKNTTFAQFWKSTDDQEAARIARNEKPM
jgi:hypothetical protein